MIFSEERANGGEHCGGEASEHEVGVPVQTTRLLHGGKIDVRKLKLMYDTDEVYHFLSQLGSQCRSVRARKSLLTKFKCIRVPQNSSGRKALTMFG